MMRHCIWPEGRPDLAEHTNSRLRSEWIQFRMGLRHLFPLYQARRVTVARDPFERPDPVALELLIQRHSRGRRPYEPQPSAEAE